jgi:hypothetical protein
MTQRYSSPESRDLGNMRLKTGADDEDSVDGATAAHRVIPPGDAETRRMIPPRYQVRDDDRGRFLTCTEAPNLSVLIDRGFSVSGSAARKYSEHTIFLDGAAQGEPFMDSGRRVYSLDHHEGCIRSFTLATCEQAMVMVLKGLDLDGEHWTLLANEPDLDTVLAVWVLLNHRRIAADNSRVRARVMPLVRLQGILDAHGFELAGMTGFPDDLQRRTQEMIDRLRANEVAQRGDGSWAANDPVDYTLGALLQIDEEIYRPGDFADQVDVEELERVPLTGDRFAVACRASIGVYEVEQHLRQVHGDRVGLIILQRGTSAWTLRQVDPFLRVGLDALYERLNLLDPSVDGDDRWGGSSEIGGSPRERGSGLGLRAITGVCRWVYRPPSLGARIRSVAAALILGGVGVGGALAAVAPNVGVVAVPGLLAHAGVTSLVRFAAALAVIAVGAVLLMAIRSRTLAGLRVPTGRGWAWLALPIMAAAAVGGGWGVLSGGSVGAPDHSLFWLHVGAVALSAAAAEVLFRGALYGLLATTFTTMIPHGRRFLSMPAALTAMMSTAWTWILFLPAPILDPLANWHARVAAWMVAATVVGLSCGVARERAASVWPPAVLHGIAVAVAYLAWSYWG